MINIVLKSQLGQAMAIASPRDKNAPELITYDGIPPNMSFIMSKIPH